jgi:hypothetical protein
LRAPERPRPAPTEAKIDWHSTPQIEVVTTAQLEQARRAAETRQWGEALGVGRVIAAAAVVFVLLVVAYQLTQQVLNGAPSEAALEELGARAGAEFLRRYSTDAQPLRFDSSRALLREGLLGGKGRYQFEVTLRLREPLFGLADSNGAQAYRDLQRSVFDAQARFVQARLYAAHPELAEPPVLPPLLARLHRDGERLIVALPVEATRELIGWQLKPVWEKARVLTPPFQGTVLAQQPQSHLVFGAISGREQMIELQEEARDYILAVQRALLGQ